MELEKCKECSVKKLYGYKIACATCKDNERRMQEFKDKSLDELIEIIANMKSVTRR